MRPISIIFMRELGAYLRSPIGWIVIALALFIDGALFQTFAVTSKPRLSADVLAGFFLYTGVLTQAVGIILASRLVAEERSLSTIVLLNTSPVRDIEIVIGKFLAALVFLSLFLVLSIYMPLLIFINGKITIAQLIVGYFGLLLLGAASLSIGLFASALTRHQIIALAVGGAINVIMVVFSVMAQKLEWPFNKVLEQLDLFFVHFQKGPMVGVLNLMDVVYYLAVIYFFLLLAVKTMGAKRWS